jgi:hypothetical protein
VCVCVCVCVCERDRERDRERERERERVREKNSSENAHADASSGGLRKEIACFTRFTGAFLQARGRGVTTVIDARISMPPQGPGPAPRLPVPQAPSKNF